MASKFPAASVRLLNASCKCCGAPDSVQRFRLTCHPSRPFATVAPSPKPAKEAGRMKWFMSYAHVYTHGKIALGHCVYVSDEHPLDQPRGLRRSATRSRLQGGGPVVWQVPAAMEDRASGEGGGWVNPRPLTRTLATREYGLWILMFWSLHQKIVGGTPNSDFEGPQRDLAHFFWLCSPARSPDIFNRHAIHFPETNRVGHRFAIFGWSAGPRFFSPPDPRCPQFWPKSDIELRP